MFHEGGKKAHVAGTLISINNEEQRVLGGSNPKGIHPEGKSLRFNKSPSSALWGVGAVQQAKKLRNGKGSLVLKEVGGQESERIQPIHLLCREILHGKPKHERGDVMMRSLCQCASTLLGKTEPSEETGRGKLTTRTPCSERCPTRETQKKPRNP